MEGDPVFLAELLFHAGGGARPGNLPAALRQFLDHREAGEDVAPGAAAGDQGWPLGGRASFWMVNGGVHGLPVLRNVEDPAGGDQRYHLAVPPCEMSGSGTPVVGSRPRPTLMCTVACSTSMAVKPQAR